MRLSTKPTQFKFIPIEIKKTFFPLRTCHIISRTPNLEQVALVAPQLSQLQKERNMPARVLRKPKNDGTHTGLAFGLDKGHAATLRARKSQPSGQRKMGRRGELVKSVIRSVVGLAPYEKRIVELLKGGGVNGAKRAQRFAKKRLGSLRRTKKKIAELSLSTE
jgi:large subunit ribosomal protein L36e